MITSGVATVLLAAVLSSCGIGGTPSNHLSAIFASTISLYPKAGVEVLGMTVGTVQSIKVLDNDQVRVDFTVHTDVPLPRGVSAVIVPESLLGARYIQLFPAWVQGQPRLDPMDPSQQVIPLSRTSVPVEPDQALAAVNNLLKALNPTATGQLITNLNTDLAGNGQNLNNAITSLSGLSNTLADKDQDLVALIDNLDQFTTVLDTRESQLGEVMDLFAQTTSLLAQERGTIASLVTNLASVSTNALDLISRHAAPLQTDIKELSDLVQTLDSNLNNVSTLLSSLPTLVAGPNLDRKAGFIAAYDPTYHRIDLRDSLGSTVNGLLQALGLPLCLAIPALDSEPQCPSGSASVPLATRAPATDQAAVLGPSQAASPLGAVLNLLGNGGTATPQVAGFGLTAPPPVTAPRGVEATVARWSQDALEQLW
jgi:phospholipid/cholesterol/gamma-HCH transport system substrate-binding protein